MFCFLSLTKHTFQTRAVAFNVQFSRGRPGAVVGGAYCLYLAVLYSRWSHLIRTIVSLHLPPPASVVSVVLGYRRAFRPLTPPFCLHPRAAGGCCPAGHRLLHPAPKPPLFEQLWCRLAASTGGFAGLLATLEWPPVATAEELLHTSAGSTQTSTIRTGMRNLPVVPDGSALSQADENTLRPRDGVLQGNRSRGQITCADASGAGSFCPF